MTALTKILFPLPDYRRTPWSLLAWWESRRLTYNLFVGATGLASLAVVLLFNVLPPAGPPILQVWKGVLIYGVLANAGYSLGWLAELGMRTLWREEAPYAGPALWRQGLSFSICLTLLPIPLAVISWVVRLVGHFF